MNASSLDHAGSFVDHAGRLAGRLWDEEAGAWAAKPEADFDKDALFRLMRGCGVLTNDLHAGMCALDVGCGSGRYSVPLARYLTAVDGKVTGCDASRDMIQAAQQRARRLRLVNTTFLALPWREFYALQCAQQNVPRYDIVFAHRTAAIADGEDLLGMTRLCCGRCFWTVIVERTNPVLAAACRAAEIAVDDNRADFALKMVRCLEAQGVKPRLTRTIEEKCPTLEAAQAQAWCLARLRLRAADRMYKPEDCGLAVKLNRAAAAVDSFIRGGKVRMYQKTKLLTVDWRP